jgi:hypothetical protein
MFKAVLWIRIRIHLDVLDPDPDPGPWKFTIKPGFLPFKKAFAPS